ncbi:hypothetical protein Taro_012059 [Colocasia esculenta]|uniref:Uncharacterized protein n=1 Tax=Colocasia esculenta TaxID=4460 RepID=A0A843UBU5_COLES|nr:hypothetical protein [Colocasia esculenta]
MTGPLPSVDCRGDGTFVVCSPLEELECRNSMLLQLQRFFCSRALHSSNKSLESSLSGVLLVVPGVVPEVVTELGLTTPKLRVTGGGVTVLVADSVIFLSTSAKNCSSISSVDIPLPLTKLCFNHGVPGEATA